MLEVFFYILLKLFERMDEMYSNLIAFIFAVGAVAL